MKINTNQTTFIITGKEKEVKIQTNEENFLGKPIYVNIGNSLLLHRQGNMNLR